MSARAEAQEWAAIVSGLAQERGLRYEPIGGINPVGAPVALCPGGTNRITGELSDGFFGSSCDADEHEEGGWGRKAVLPGALLVKSHMPDLATVVPVFDVESIERTPEDAVDRHSRRRVEFESIDFNKRFIATVPHDHDPVALRELFSPGFIDWITRIPAQVDFGITDQQLFFPAVGSSTASIVRWRRTTWTSTGRARGTPGSSSSRRRSEPSGQHARAGAGGRSGRSAGPS